MQFHTNKRFALLVLCYTIIASPIVTQAKDERVEAFFPNRPVRYQPQLQIPQPVLRRDLDDLLGDNEDTSTSAGTSEAPDTSTSSDTLVPSSSEGIIETTTVVASDSTPSPAEDIETTTDESVQPNDDWDNSVTATVPPEANTTIEINTTEEPVTDAIGTAELDEPEEKDSNDALTFTQGSTTIMPSSTQEQEEGLSTSTTNSSDTIPIVAPLGLDGTNGTGAGVVGAGLGANAGAAQAGSSDDKEKGVSVGLIIGIVCGVVALLAIIGLVAFFYIRRRKKKEQELKEKDVEAAKDSKKKEDSEGSGSKGKPADDNKPGNKAGPVPTVGAAGIPGKDKERDKDQSERSTKSGAKDDSDRSITDSDKKKDKKSKKAEAGDAKQEPTKDKVAAGPVPVLPGGEPDAKNIAAGSTGDSGEGLKVESKDGQDKSMKMASNASTLRHMTFPVESEVQDPLGLDKKQKKQPRGKGTYHDDSDRKKKSKDKSKDKKSKKSKKAVKPALKAPPKAKGHVQFDNEEAALKTAKSLTPTRRQKGAVSKSKMASLKMQQTPYEEPPAKPLAGKIIKVTWKDGKPQKHIPEATPRSPHKGKVRSRSKSPGLTPDKGSQPRKDSKKGGKKEKEIVKYDKKDKHKKKDLYVTPPNKKEQNKKHGKSLDKKKSSDKDQKDKKYEAKKGHHQKDKKSADKKGALKKPEAEVKKQKSAPNKRKEKEMYVANANYKKPEMYKKPEAYSKPERKGSKNKMKVLTPNKKSKDKKSPAKSKPKKKEGFYEEATQESDDKNKQAAASYPPKRARSKELKNAPKIAAAKKQPGDDSLTSEGDDLAPRRLGNAPLARQKKPESLTPEPAKPVKEGSIMEAERRRKPKGPKQVKYEVVPPVVPDDTRTDPLQGVGKRKKPTSKGLYDKAPAPGGTAHYDTSPGAAGKIYADKAPGGSKKRGRSKSPARIGEQDIVEVGLPESAETPYDSVPEGQEVGEEPMEAPGTNDTQEQQQQQQQSPQQQRQTKKQQQQQQISARMQHSNLGTFDNLNGASAVLDMDEVPEIQDPDQQYDTPKSVNAKSTGAFTDPFDPKKMVSTKTDPTDWKDTKKDSKKSARKEASARKKANQSKALEEEGVYGKGGENNEDEIYVAPKTKMKKLSDRRSTSKPSKNSAKKTKCQPKLQKSSEKRKKSTEINNPKKSTSKPNLKKLATDRTADSSNRQLTMDPLETALPPSATRKLMTEKTADSSNRQLTMDPLNTALPPSASRKTDRLDTALPPSSATTGKSDRLETALPPSSATSRKTDRLETALPPSSRKSETMGGQMTQQTGTDQLDTAVPMTASMASRKTNLTKQDTQLSTDQFETALPMSNADQSAIPASNQVNTQSTEQQTASRKFFEIRANSNPEEQDPNYEPIMKSKSIKKAGKAKKQPSAAKQKERSKAKFAKQSSKSRSKGGKRPAKNSKQKMVKGQVKAGGKKPNESTMTMHGLKSIPLDPVPVKSAGSFE